MPAAVDGLKECTKCGETKPVSEYSKYKSAPDGYQYYCKSCRRKYYQNNKECMSKWAKKYYQTNKEHTLKRAKKYREANKERIRKHDKEYYEANKERIRKHKKEYHQKLPAAVYKIENKITGKIYIGQSRSYGSCI